MAKDTETEAAPAEAAAVSEPQEAAQDSFLPEESIPDLDAAFGNDKPQGGLLAALVEQGDMEVNPQDASNDVEGEAQRAAAVSEEVESEEQEPATEVLATESEEQEAVADDFDFPVLGDAEEKAEEAKPAFDEAAFDAETDQVLAKIEEKGHPGDVYKDLRQELKAEKMRAESGPELQKLQEENAKLQAEAERVQAMQEKMEAMGKDHAELKVKSLPEWEQTVERPIAAMEDALVSIGKIIEAEPAELAAIITEQDIGVQDAMLAKLEARLGGMDGVSARRQIGRIERIADDYRNVAEVKKSMLENAQREIDASKEQQSARMAAEQEEFAGKYRDAAQVAFTKYAKSVPGFIDDAGALNDTGKAALRSAYTVDSSKLSVNDIAFLIFASKAMPQMARDLKRVRTENRDLKVATNKKGGSKSSVNPGSASAPTSAGKEDMTETFMDRMSKISF